MFVQVFQGGVKDPDGLKKSLDRWITDLGPQADGWLGTTWGLYGDKEFIVLARFASADAAKRNSERPEHGADNLEAAKALCDGHPFLAGAPAVPSRARGGLRSCRRLKARPGSATTTTSSCSAPAARMLPDSSRSCRDGWSTSSASGP